MRLLRHDGLEKAAAGMTTIEEVMRVTASDDGPSSNDADKSPSDGHVLPSRPQFLGKSQRDG